jgi:hypothetical protein
VVLYTILAVLLTCFLGGKVRILHQEQTTKIC